MNLTLNMANKLTEYKMIPMCFIKNDWPYFDYAFSAFTAIYES